MYILDLDHTSSFFCSSFLPSNECNDLQYVFSLYSEIVSKASYKVSADLCCRRHCLTCALTRRDVARLAQQVASLGGGWQHLGSIQQEVKAGKPWKKQPNIQWYVPPPLHVIAYMLFDIPHGALSRLACGEKLTKLPPCRAYRNRYTEIWARNYKHLQTMQAPLACDIWWHTAWNHDNHKVYCNIYCYVLHCIANNIH